MPTDFGATVKMAITLKTTVRATNNVETQLREKGLEKDKAGEKRKLEGSSRSDKKGRFSKSNLDDQKYGVVVEPSGVRSVRIGTTGDATEK